MGSNPAAPTIDAPHLWIAALSDSATLTETFQFEIPEPVRTAYHWEAGQEFVFLPKGTGVLLVPVPTRPELMGLAEGADPTGYRDRDDRA